jgi:hypothetical protein
MRMLIDPLWPGHQLRLALSLRNGGLLDDPELQDAATLGGVRQQKKGITQSHAKTELQEDCNLLF